MGMAPTPKLKIVKVGDVCIVEGIVQISSKAKSLHPVLAYLPEGCLPNRRLIFNQARLEDETAVNNVRVDVLVSGEIIAITNNEAGAVISMDGIIFSPQGSKELTKTQEKKCKGWEKPSPPPPAPPPPMPPGKLNWISQGCWWDGGGDKEEMIAIEQSNSLTKMQTATLIEEEEAATEEGEAYTFANAGRRRERRRKKRMQRPGNKKRVIKQQSKNA